MTFTESQNGRRIRKHEFSGPEPSHAALLHDLCYSGPSIRAGGCGYYGRVDGTLSRWICVAGMLLNREGEQLPERGRDGRLGVGVRFVSTSLSLSRSLSPLSHSLSLSPSLLLSYPLSYSLLLSLSLTLFSATLYRTFPSFEKTVLLISCFPFVIFKGPSYIITFYILYFIFKTERPGQRVQLPPSVHGHRSHLSLRQW